MDLAEVQRHWDFLGRTDPYWAILTDPTKRHGGWELTEFLASGERLIGEVMAEVDALGWQIRKGRALDFGCGVGRLTQALGNHFDQCDGVDIAPSMIAQARALNRHGDRCQYTLNATDDLSCYPDSAFDFVFSFIVLQHIEPRYIEAYLREFLRVLAPGGLIHVQIPAERRQIVNEVLPDEAFRAGLTLQAPINSLEAGSAAVVHVAVENQSSVAWPAYGPADCVRPIHLGNHWRDARGELLVGDDGRSVFPASVLPGAKVDLPLAVRAPMKPGRYILEVDVVQETVAWFAAKGSPTLRVPVEVTPRPGRSAQDWIRALWRRDCSHSETFEPVMEMYVVSEERVATVVQEAGGRIVHQRCWPGADFRHATYLITKDPRGSA